MNNCILGVRNLTDLDEIVKAVEAGGNWPKIPLNRYSVNNETMVNPAMWKRK